MRRLAWAAIIAVSLSLIVAAPTLAQWDEDDEGWAPFVSVSVGGVWPSLELGNPPCTVPVLCPYAPITMETYFGFEVAGSAGLEMGWIRWDVFEIAYDQVQSAAKSVVPNIDGTTSLLSLGTGFRVGPFQKDYRVYPYVSLGFAGGRLETNGSGIFTDFSQWGFEWSAGAGVEARILDRLRAGVRYRYRSVSMENSSTSRNSITLISCTRC